MLAITKINTTRAIVKDAMNIYELHHALETICDEHGIEIENADDWYIYDEAKYVLSTFYETGHVRNSWLTGDDDANPKETKKEIQKLTLFLKKYKKVYE